MKQTTLKMTTLMLLAFFGLIGCLSTEGQAETTTPAATKPANTQFVEGKHYIDIFPEMNTNTAAGQIEVLELFWLGCPHCYSLEPTIKQFLKNKPADVDFHQVPAVLNPQWSFHAKAFYTAQILDPKNEKHLLDKLFKEIHEKNNNLNSPESLKKFFTDQGYTATQFNNTFNSMALNAAMSNARTVSGGSQATSVPTIIINGKYRTSPYMAGGEENLMKVMKMLIQKERK